MDTVNFWSWSPSSSPLSHDKTLSTPSWKPSWGSFPGDPYRTIQSVDKQTCARIPAAVSLTRSIPHILVCIVLFCFVLYLTVYLGDLSRSAVGEHSSHIPLSEYNHVSNPSLVAVMPSIQSFAAANNAAISVPFTGVFLCMLIYFCGINS